jgi:hypothetical protein
VVRRARFFGYLESKAYKMHIRVLLSKYRSYTPCGTCGGARLKLSAAVAHGLEGRCRRRAAAGEKRILPGGRGLEPRAAGGAARPEPARPDAAADRPAARFFDGPDACRAPCSTKR